ncbi:MAG: transcription antitermination factor NusB [Clostridia bacterium]|nr:transcription antitermination factor NusB [Clostridia bacterium]
MKRRLARENAVMALYEASFNATQIEDIIAASRESKENEIDSFGEALIVNFYAHSSEVDDAIKSKLKDWTLDRLPRVDAAILRLAVTEMIFSTEEDMDSVVINEAVEIAKKYSGDSNYQFINGVLGALAHKTEVDETPCEASETQGES